MSISNKCLLVFDLNGTLTCTSNTRHRKGILVRPGIEHLNRLIESRYYDIAIWSSAMRHNVLKMVKEIEKRLDYKINIILDRSNTIPSPTSDNSHATKKPLLQTFPTYGNVILIDDDVKKCLDEEVTGHFVKAPQWDGDKDDRFLAELVDYFLSNQ